MNNGDAIQIITYDENNEKVEGSVFMIDSKTPISFRNQWRFRLKEIPNLRG